MDSILERLPLVFAQFLPFMIAIVFHEAAHAFVAAKHGDFTARDLGRETLNPLPHIDPIGTVAFPFFGMLTGIPVLFGWAKPVPINYNRLKPYRRGLFLVSMAGIIMNFILSFFSAGIFVLLKIVPEFYLTEPFVIMTQASISINLWLAFFNLIPLPPLDGSKAIEAFLSYDKVRKFESIQQYSFFILMGLILSGALSVLQGPVFAIANGFIRIWVWMAQTVGVGLFSGFGAF
jgi:Zn-dependent protease